MQLRPGKILTAIGLMSGTSMDGIDIALLRSDGEAMVERIAGGEYPYGAEFRQRLTDALGEAAVIRRREDRPGNLGALEREITLAHADAVRRFMATQGIAPGSIDVVGFHGQTVLHRPELALTVQLGDGALLARELSIPVVFDMRARDMEEGGQGAPLVPAYHKALAAGLPEPLRSMKPVAFVNIGGISNITNIGRDGAPVAFDTGPGNALIDQWVMAEAGIPYDQDGRIAAEGAILPALVARYMASPFFADTPPKSLDRNDFLPPETGEAALEDGARSLARVTAEAILRARDHLSESPALWIICGGGRLNPAIMSDLRELVSASGAEVIRAEQAGLDGGSMEAEAWAYLAIRSLRGLPLTWPMTTGCAKPVTGGVLALPADETRA